MLAYLIAEFDLQLHVHTHTQPSELNEVDSKHLELINHYTNKNLIAYTYYYLIEYLPFV